MIGLDSLTIFAVVVSLTFMVTRHMLHHRLMSL